MMKKTNQSFEQLNDTPPLEFTADQLCKLASGIRERASKKGLESFGITILIVEDQDFSRKILHDLLARQENYSCHAAKNALEAIELYSTHAPDIVLLDIQLPDYSGHELASILKQADPRSYIVHVTANKFIKDVEAAKKNNVQGFITKPYSKKNIQNVISNYINQQAKR